MIRKIDGRRWRVLKQHSNDSIPQELGEFDDEGDARLKIREELHGLMAFTYDQECHLDTMVDAYGEPYRWMYTVEDVGTVTFSLQVRYDNG